MKKGFAHLVKPLLAVLLLSLCFGMLGAASAAETTYSVQLTGTYSQTEARKMLSMINSFRTGSDAWYWSEDNQTKTQCSNLQNLDYDYDLEKIAMLRAAEIALRFDHTRPNGGTCFDAYKTVSSTYTAVGENIAAGYSSTESTFVQWREDDEKYSGQGHRRNMLSSSFNAVGIGHVAVNGTHYWVQEFGMAASPNTTQTPANDSETSVSIQIASSAILGVEAPFNVNTLSMTYGDSQELYADTLAIYVRDKWPGNRPTFVGVSCTWQAEDSSIVSLTPGTIHAQKAGDTAITTTALGYSVRMPVHVDPRNLSGATITLDIGEEPLVYDGEPKTPAVRSVVCDGRTLQQDVDFTVSYADNTQPGTAKVTITGIGNYTGSAQAQFEIANCEPTGITLSGPSTANIDEIVYLTATLEPAGARSELRWSSSREDVALVFPNGSVESRMAGTTVITVTTENNLSATHTLTVVDPEGDTRPTGITVTPSGTVDLPIGNTLQLSATLEPDTASSELTWSSGEEAIATVDADGLVTARGPGKTTITVTAVKKGPNNRTVLTWMYVNCYDPAVPSSLTLNKTGTQVMSIDDELQLVATVLPETARSELKWESSEPGVATVDANGLVSPVAEGRTVITVTELVADASGSNLTASVTVDVVDPYKPQEIYISPAGDVELALRQTCLLTAVLKPASARSEFDWKSDDPAIADVDSSGLVTAVGEGSTVITVTAKKLSPSGETLSASANVRVTDPSKPTGIELDQTGTVDLAIDGTLQFHATLQPETARSELEWSSSEPDIADVDGEGLVTPFAEGRATITVRALERSAAGAELSASVIVNVVPGSAEAVKPTGITLKPSGTVVMNVRQELQLNATLQPAGAKSELEWSSSNEDAAIVSDSGLVTSIGEGTTVITVKAVERSATGAEVFARVMIDVLDSGEEPDPSEPDPDNPDPSEPDPDNPDPDPDLPDPERPDPTRPTAISLDEAGPVDLDIWDMLELHATLEPETARSELEWSSSNPNVAQVSRHGLVLPEGEGMAIITVKAKELSADGRKLSASVAVKVIDEDNPKPAKPTKAKLDRSGKITLSLYEELRLFATVEPENAWSDFRWSSSNAKIAKVDQHGLVTPVKEGKATITAKTTKKGSKGKALSAKVTVQVVDPYRPTGIALNESGTVALNIDETLPLVATLEPEDAQSGLKWSSSNAKIAKVSQDGLVTPVKEGKATITAKATKKSPKGKALSAKVTVQVVDPYKPTGVALNYSGTVNLDKGKTLQLFATLEPEGIARSELKWSSSKKIAAVDGDGLVTAKKEGTAKITVKTRNGKTASVKIHVVDLTKATSVALNYTEPVELPLNEKLTLIATMQPEATATSKLSWTSSDKKVAALELLPEEDAPANVRIVVPKKKGSVTITVKTSTGKKASVKVKIVDAVPEFDLESPAAPEAEESPAEPEEQQLEPEEQPPEAEDASADEIESEAPAIEAEGVPEEEAS